MQIMYDIEDATDYAGMIGMYEGGRDPADRSSKMVFPTNLGKEDPGGIAMVTFDSLGNDRIGDTALDMLIVNDLDTEALAEAAQMHGYRFRETEKEFRVDKTYSVFGKRFALPGTAPAIWSSKDMGESQSFVYRFGNEDSTEIIDSYLYIVQKKDQEGA